MSSDEASRRSQSAGTMSPSARATMSPGTSCALGNASSTPSRRTLTDGAFSCASAVIARSALISSKTPTVVFTSTTIPITAASVRSPVARVNAQAARSTTMSGSRSCTPMLDHTETRPRWRSSFGPTS